MNNKKVFSILAAVLAVTISIAACSPKAAPDQPAPSQTEEPVEQPTENPSSQAALGDCYNPFNPVVEGKVWKYTTDSGDATSTLEVSFKDITASTFTSVQKFADISTEVQWTCSPDGMLSSQFAMMSIPLVPGVEFETLEVNGVVIPTEDKWQVGYSWDTQYVIKIKYTSGETVFEGQGNFTLANTIAAEESVTVPAGTYSDAFLVETSGSLVMNIMGTETTLPITFSTWYVKDIGMVKNALTDSTLKYSTELVSIE